MKKFILVSVLAAAVAGGVFAQEIKNFVGGTVGLLDVGGHYERMLTPKFSVGAEVYWNSLFIIRNTIGFKAFGRMYPLNNGFFADLGLGFGIYTGDQDYEYEWAGQTYTERGLAHINGFLIEPGVGWKFDFKAPGGFYLEPAISVPIVLGQRDFIIGWGNYDKDFGAGVNVRARVGLGYAF
jgi:hypothetical protein